MGQVDIVKIIYKELFTVKFLHDGYGVPRPNFIADSITLEPDDDTKFLFKNFDITHRFFNDMLICLMRCDETVPVVPYIKFSGNVRLRFFINASTDFINKTVVDTVGAKQVYQFTNQVNAGTLGFICMHTTGVNVDDLKNVDVVKPDKNCFGVIDIHNSGAVNSSYDLFSGTDQNLKSPAYSLQFVSKI